MPHDTGPVRRYHQDMRLRIRPITVWCVVAAAVFGAGSVARAQQATMAPLPASAVMARGAGNGWQSQGGVVGPWWTGSNSGVQPPAADGGFWFGFPGLGFGGSQGSTRSLGGVGSTLTTTPGADGMISSGRLIPFVTGVIPVVGSGSSAPTAWPHSSPMMLPSTRPAAPRPATLAAPPQTGWAPIRPSTPASRARAQKRVAAGDAHLLSAGDGPTVARAALAEYRAAGRFAQDDCDILIRQAILHAALGQSDATERAIARAVLIDGRLAEPLTSTSANGTGHANQPPAPVPAVAARGETILRELSDSGGQPPAADPPARAVLDWLAAAWQTHWSATAAPRSGGKP